MECFDHTLSAALQALRVQIQFDVREIINAEMREVQVQDLIVQPFKEAIKECLENTHPVPKADQDHQVNLHEEQIIENALRLAQSWGRLVPLEHASQSEMVQPLVDNGSPNSDRKQKDETQRLCKTLQSTNSQCSVDGKQDVHEKFEHIIEDLISLAQVMGVTVNKRAIQGNLTCVTQLSPSEQDSPKKIPPQSTVVLKDSVNASNEALGGMNNDEAPRMLGFWSDKGSKRCQSKAFNKHFDPYVLERSNQIPWPSMADMFTHPFQSCKQLHKKAKQAHRAFKVDRGSESMQLGMLPGQTHQKGLAGLVHGAWFGYAVGIMVAANAFHWLPHAMEA